MRIAQRELLLASLALLTACVTELPTGNRVTVNEPNNPSIPSGGGTGGGPITTFTTPASGTCPSAISKSVLVDPTHDGGVWWFPQAASKPEDFDPNAPHQGRALAQYIRNLGYTVTELGRGATLPTDSLREYATVIRAGYYYDALRPGYSGADIDAYRAYVQCPRTLVLLGEFLRDGRRDMLADSLDMALTGMIGGTITDFAPHALTTDVTNVPFMVGSYLASESNPAIQVLGRLPTGEAVMGVMAKGDGQVFFIGNTNGLQQLPQPLLANLVAWGFR